MHYGKSDEVHFIICVLFSISPGATHYYYFVCCLIQHGGDNATVVGCIEQENIRKLTLLSYYFRYLAKSREQLLREF